MNSFVQQPCMLVWGLCYTPVLDTHPPLCFSEVHKQATIVLHKKHSCPPLECHETAEGISGIQGGRWGAAGEEEGVVVLAVGNSVLVQIMKRKGFGALALKGRVGVLSKRRSRRIVVLVLSRDETTLWSKPRFGPNCSSSGPLFGGSHASNIEAVFLLEFPLVCIRFFYMWVL